MAPARPMGVAFEAWPAARKSTRQPAPEIITHHHPEHAISLQYLALLDQITEALRYGNGVVLLAGVRGLVGTSTVVLNLAVASARRRNKRVVIWEASLGKTPLAVRLGLAASLGMNDVLTGSAGLEQAILEAASGGLFLLPAQGETRLRTATACTPEAARWLVAWLRERFDLVFVDGPNLDDNAALGVLAPLADDIYIVAPQTDKHLVHPGLAQTIASMGGHLRGLIHTQFEG